jgi:hypothetical protein
MRAEVFHKEIWQVTLRREDGDEGWPDEFSARWSGSRVYRPDTIHSVIERGEKGPSLGVSGLNIKKDGTTGQIRGGDRSYGQPVRDGHMLWAANLVEEYRQANGLGPGATGCGW